MEEKYLEKLTQELSERISNSLKEEIKQVKEQNVEAVEKLKEQNKDFALKLEQIQKLPAQKVAVDVPGKETKVHFYKGYDLRKQGENLSIEPKFIVTPEDRDNISKWFIDVINGKATNIEGNAARGGYLVNDEISDVVMAHARLSSMILQEANVIPMNSDTLRIPKEDAAVSVTFTGEEDSIGETNPTFGEIVLSAVRLGGLSIVSNELLADNSYDFVSLLTSQFGEAIGQTLDNACFNGVGTITGCLSGASVTVSCEASATSPNRHIQLTDKELSLAISKLTDNKLMGAKFYFHQNSMHYVRQLKDSQGRPIFAMPGNGVPGTAYEYPIRVGSKVGTATPGADTPFALFGNLKRYYVVGRRNGNMVLEVDPYGLFSTYRTRFRMITRWDGAVTLADGLVAIKTKA